MLTTDLYATAVMSGKITVDADPRDEPAIAYSDVSVQETKELATTSTAQYSRFVLPQGSDKESAMSVFLEGVNYAKRDARVVARYMAAAENTEGSGNIATVLGIVALVDGLVNLTKLELTEYTPSPQRYAHVGNGRQTLVVNIRENVYLVLVDAEFGPSYLLGGEKDVGTAKEIHALLSKHRAYGPVYVCGLNSPDPVVLEVFSRIKLDDMSPEQTIAYGTIISAAYLAAYSQTDNIDPPYQFAAYAGLVLGSLWVTESVHSYAHFGRIAFRETHPEEEEKIFPDMQPTNMHAQSKLGRRICISGCNDTTGNTCIVTPYPSKGELVTKAACAKSPE
jgi:hypothetical protein